MDKVNKFESLEAWKEAHKFTLEIYKITKNFPSEETYRLVDQLCRSSASTAAILVEGNSRGSTKEYIHFAYQSRASLEESKYHLLLAKDLGYIQREKYNELIAQADKIGKLINGLIKYLKTKI